MHFRLVVAASIVALGCGGSQAKDPLATDDPAPVAPSARAKVAANGWVSLGGADAALISEFRTAEYERQWGLGAIRAAEAYALLKKNGLAVGGAGAVVAVSDAGIDFAHPELVGAKHSAGHTAIAGARDGSGYTDAHGTHIAGTIAARRDALGMHGVAFASKLVAFSENRVVDIAAADKAGVHVVNMSWAGGVCNNEHATTATKIATACDAANRDNVQVGAAIAEDDLDLVNDRDMAVFRNVLGAAAAGGVIMVASLAQGAEERHGYPVGFASEPALSGLLVAVGALDNKLAPVSMGCGKSPEAVVERCLFAPGMRVLSPAAGKFDEGGKRTVDQREYYSWSGTSHAVPHVVGALAVLRGAWPKAPASLLVKALFAGARSMHAAGEARDKPSRVFGRGRLDLAGAVDYLGRALGPAQRP